MQLQPMTISPKTFATALGVLGILAGIILLFSPVHASIVGEALDCGPAGHPRSEPVAADGEYTDNFLAAAACSEETHSRGVPAWIALGAGVVVLAGARFVRWSVRP